MERERRLRTSLAAMEACVEYGWETERAASLAARIRTLLAERVPVGRAGRVEGAETLSAGLRTDLPTS